MNRRLMLSSTALSALAACSLVTPANVATVESVIAKIQALMPYVSGIASVIGVVVPGASAAVSVIEGAFTTASGIFANLTASMTAAAAQPIVGRIATYIDTAITSAKSIATQLPTAAQTTVNGLLAEAESVLADVVAFASPTPSMAALRAVVPVHMFIRQPR